MPLSRVASCFVATMAAFAPVTAASAGGSLKDVATPVHTAWHGVYVGVQASYNSFDADGIFDLAGTKPHANFAQYDLDGFGAGINAGYNHRIWSLVLGVEVDYVGTDIQDDFLDGSRPTRMRQELSLSGLGSIRGRVGYVHNNSLLLYGTVGIGQIRGELSVENGADGFQFDETGLVYGGGVEWMFAKNLSLKAEYLRFDIDARFDLNPLTGGDPGDNLGLNGVDSIRIGLNFHLN